MHDEPNPLIDPDFEPTVQASQDISDACLELEQHNHSLTSLESLAASIETTLAGDGAGLSNQSFSFAQIAANCLGQCVSTETFVDQRGADHATSHTSSRQATQIGLESVKTTIVAIIEKIIAFCKSVYDKVVAFFKKAWAYLLDLKKKALAALAEMNHGTAHAKVRFTWYSADGKHQMSYESAEIQDAISGAKKDASAAGWKVNSHNDVLSVTISREVIQSLSVGGDLDTSHYKLLEELIRQMKGDNPFALPPVPEHLLTAELFNSSGPSFARSCQSLHHEELSKVNRSWMASEQTYPGNVSFKVELTPPGESMSPAECLKAVVQGPHFTETTKTSTNRNPFAWVDFQWVAAVLAAMGEIVDEIDVVQASVMRNHEAILEAIEHTKTAYSDPKYSPQAVSAYAQGLSRRASSQAQAYNRTTTYVTQSLRHYYVIATAWIKTVNAAAAKQAAAA